jgi:hypothetical protein
LQLLLVALVAVKHEYGRAQHIVALRFVCALRFASLLAVQTAAFVVHTYMTAELPGAFDTLQCCNTFTHEQSATAG